MTFHFKYLSSLLAVTGLFILSACSSKHKETAIQNSDAAIPVTVATPAGSSSPGLNVSGQVEASQTANISTRVSGFISMLKVKVGDPVSKGQLLATISNQDMLARRSQTDAMISEAQAVVNNAKKDVDRFTILYKQQSATAKELDNVTLQYNAAKARLEAARQMRNEVNASLGYTQLTAPFSGIVIQKMAEAGTLVNPGMPILTIEQNGSYQVSASVPENSISQIKMGAQANIAITSIEKIIPATVTQINPSSQFSGGQYIIKLNIPDAYKKGLYAGMYATVTIPTTSVSTTSNNDNTIWVPLGSIIKKDQLTGLYSISSNNTALLRWVRLGKTYADKVEVLSGLAKDEPFILSAEGKLYNGAPVKIKK